MMLSQAALTSPTGFKSSRSMEDHSTHTSRSSPADSQLPSVLNGSVGQSDDSTVQNKASVERRVAWLEEEVAVLQHRLRDVYTSGVGGGLCRAADGDARLRELVARLDGDLEDEKQTRGALEERVGIAEGQLQTFAVELERTMTEIIGRIDRSLSAAPTNVSSYEPKTGTEAKIITLIQRVDKGLLAGAEALQERLTSSPPGPMEGAKTEELLQSWEQIRGESPSSRGRQVRFGAPPQQTTAGRQPSIGQAQPTNPAGMPTRPLMSSISGGTMAGGGGPLQPEGMAQQASVRRRSPDASGSQSFRTTRRLS